MVATFRRTAPIVDDLGRTLLDAVFGAAAVDALVERAGASLERRLRTLAESERGRYVAVLDALDLPADAPDQLRAASRRVDDRRFEQARSGAETTT